MGPPAALGAPPADAPDVACVDALRAVLAVTLDQLARTHPELRRRPAGRPGAVPTARIWAVEAVTTLGGLLDAALARYLQVHAADHHPAHHDSE